METSSRQAVPAINGGNGLGGIFRAFSGQSGFYRSIGATRNRFDNDDDEDDWPPKRTEPLALTLTLPLFCPSPPKLTGLNDLPGDDSGNT
jgi:hypothetical protein